MLQGLYCSMITIFMVEKCKESILIYICDGPPCDDNDISLEFNFMALRLPCTEKS